MTSNPNFNAPVLNYVGSVDIATATSGSTLYNILFDSDLSMIGNILMFEYKIQPANVLVTEPENILLGYINIENASNTGITNQWTLAVPARDNNYKTLDNLEIQVRVYSGLKGTTEIAVSPWSNSLALHNPPEKPSINKAYFNNNISDIHELTIFMDINPSYNYDEVLFIVAYYFQDEFGGGTIWNVSDPLQAVSVTEYTGQEYRRLHVPDIGNVDPNNNTVYIAVYTVYSFINNGENYYSVSEISETYNAEIITTDETPTIISLEYLIYDESLPSQNMVISWNPPITSLIPYFEIAYYSLVVTVNNSPYIISINSSIPSTQLSYTYDVSRYNCSDNLSYQVNAVFVNSRYTNMSNSLSLNVFKYSSAPQNLFVVSASPHEISISFENPQDIGCGPASEFEVTFAFTNVGPTDKTYFVEYDPDAPNYIINYNDVLEPGYNYGVGSVTVLLKTKDTNSNNYFGGEVASTPFIMSTLTLNDVDYKVYENNSQDMVLTWDNFDTQDTGWNISTYRIFLDNQEIGDTNLLYWTYNNTSLVCGTNLNFCVKAYLENNGTQVIIVSNIVSVNIFKTADAPSSIDSILASSDFANTRMDLTYKFMVPLNYYSGCGTILNWLLIVENENNTQIYSRTIPYVDSKTEYVGLISSLPYYSNGLIKVLLQTEDTNSTNAINGQSISVDFITYSRPHFYNVYITPDQRTLNIEILSNSLLAPVGSFLWFTPSTVIPQRNELTWSTSTELITNVDGVYKFIYQFNNSFFNRSTIPKPITTIISNSGGYAYYTLTY